MTNPFRELMAHRRSTSRFAHRLAHAAALLGISLGVLSQSSNPSSGQTAEMPSVTRFPAEASYIGCPNLEMGRRLFQDFHLGANGRFDEELLERGLAETGCRWKKGPFRIERAIDMKTIFETRLLFLGWQGTPEKPDYGIVNLTIATALPQTQRDDWMRTFAPGGRIRTAPVGSLAYVCPNADAARRVVAAIPKPQPQPTTGLTPSEGSTASRDRAPFEKALLDNSCARTEATYRVTALHEMAGHKLKGRSAAENWIALSVIGGNGRDAGLVYDMVRGFYALYPDGRRPTDR
jgi:hypothetical protein